MTAAVVLCAAAPVSAAVVTYFDRTAWSNAVGSPIMTEDFNSFGVDTEFRTAPLAILNGTIQEVNGPSANDPNANFIDVSPFCCGDRDINGTPYVAADIAGSNDTMVRIDFTMGITAWGADFESLESTFGDVFIDVFDGTDQLIGPTLSAVGNTFWGFNLDAGEVAAHIIIRRTTTVGNEFFS